jgi:hypothetical protein
LFSVKFQHEDGTEVSASRDCDSRRRAAKLAADVMAALQHVVSFEIWHGKQLIERGFKGDRIVPDPNFSWAEGD